MTESNESFLRQNSEMIVITVLSVLVIFIYAQTVGFNFINFDDNLYIYENRYVAGGLSLTNIQWAFTQFHSANWHPLTWISHQLDATLFGLNAGGHHASNVIFHLINSILAFVVFKKYTGDFAASAIIAALFAVHPMHVESVAWVSERKDVLSTMFWLLTMWAYFAYVKKDKNLNYYLLTIALFILGLLSKPMLVTLPFVLLLLDYGVLERLKTKADLKELIVEKIPFFALSAISAYLTILAQKSWGAIQSLDVLPFQTRFFNAFISYVKYIISFFYPAKMSVWYPYDTNLSAFEITGAIGLIIAVSALCIRKSEKKYLLTGWLWFLGTLVPVIGLVQVGNQPIADRYTYVPFFGLFIMLVFGLKDVFDYFKVDKKIFCGVWIIAILIFSLAAHRQTSFWNGDESLYKHSLSVTSDNYIVLQTYCHHLMLKDRLDEAEKLCRQAIDIKPDFAGAQNALGIVEFKRGNFEAAAENFKKTIDISPNYEGIYLNYSNALSLSGNPEEAEEQLKKASVVTPPSANLPVWIESLNNLAFSYGKKKKFENAAENFERILQIAPDRSDVRANYATTLLQLKKVDDAQRQIEQAIRENPAQAENHYNYGLILLERKEVQKAAEQFQKAVQLKPDFKEAQENLKRTREAK